MWKRYAAALNDALMAGGLLGAGAGFSCVVVACLLGIIAGECGCNRPTYRFGRIGCCMSTNYGRMADFLADNHGSRADRFTRFSDFCGGCMYRGRR
ncbi:MAG: hypothetical protein L0H29_10335 [Sinobacteraceae bacterium]|nr:hypothetical protein [Nevskiaceae bacterium]